MSDSATLEANKAIARRWGELQDRGQISSLDEVATPDCVIHHPGGVDIRGLEAVKEAAFQFAAAFSEISHQLEIQVAEGDLVASRFRLTATHTGEFLGLAPTGNSISFTGIEICRVTGGKFSECWVELDGDTFNRQLRGDAASTAPESS
jgi:predicted ester cyclase